MSESAPVFTIIVNPLIIRLSASTAATNHKLPKRSPFKCPFDTYRHAALAHLLPLSQRSAHLWHLILLVCVISYLLWNTIQLSFGFTTIHSWECRSRDLVKHCQQLAAPDELFITAKKNCSLPIYQSKKYRGEAIVKPICMLMVCRTWCLKDMTSPSARITIERGD